MKGYTIHTVPVFEFDPAKSRVNRTKHGIDFNEAQAIWRDVDRVELPARSEREPRRMVIGRIGPHVWSAFITDRQGTYGDTTIRIISVRRARPKERRAYLAG